MTLWPCFPVLIAVLTMLGAGAAARGQTVDDHSARIVVLGSAQDAGCPQLGCEKPCCRPRPGRPVLRRFAASLAILVPQENRSFLIDVSPDIREQMQILEGMPAYHRPAARRPVDGVLLTHAHIGHYAGLIHFGREAMSTDHVPVWCTHRMKEFLATNAPWSLLVELGNLDLREFSPGSEVRLGESVSVLPILVPHRGEFSDTVGFVIQAPSKKVLYIPDVDQWQLGERSLSEWIQSVDAALLDGTFFSEDELPGRDIREIPHPLITQTMEGLAVLSPAERAKVRFIHLNHTNPARQPESPERQRVLSAGFGIAEEGQVIDLGVVNEKR